MSDGSIVVEGNKSCWQFSIEIQIRLTHLSNVLKVQIKHWERGLQESVSFNSNKVIQSGTGYLVQ